MHRSQEEDVSENLPGLVCTPGEKTTTQVIHSDRTDTLVPAQLTVMEQNALLKYSFVVFEPVKNCLAYDIPAHGDLLTKLIRNGPKQYPFKFDELRDILLRGSRIFLAEPSLLEDRFPKNIFLCRGNHEEESLNRAYSFHDEVCSRFPDNPGNLILF
ncbi:unnamed protein product [Gongylonema pulchrum]|uniref:SER_THR_PHOSPHATASE domain-containing protein n=1 Tax=Gongylonema pulchrum TaxID=637853 RepID=A0A183E2S7_9BILA|nr:unnamed protein product [Gongylonema pulchrum]